MDCVWLLNYEEGQQIVLSRFSVNMEHSDTVTCGQRGASYVTIRNGGMVNFILNSWSFEMAITPKLNLIYRISLNSVRGH